MKIIISADDGTVIDIIEKDDIGDLSKTMPQALLMNRIKEALEKADDE